MKFTEFFSSEKCSKNNWKFLMIWESWKFDYQERKKFPIKSHQNEINYTSPCHNPSLLHRNIVATAATTTDRWATTLNWLANKLKTYTACWVELLKKNNFYSRQNQTFQFSCFFSPIQSNAWWFPRLWKVFCCNEKSITDFMLDYGMLLRRKPIKVDVNL